MHLFRKTTPYDTIYRAIYDSIYDSIYDAIYDAIIEFGCNACLTAAICLWFRGP